MAALRPIYYGNKVNENEGKETSWA